jgi:hypothetical protein
MRQMGGGLPFLLRPASSRSPLGYAAMRSMFPWRWNNSPQWLFDKMALRNLAWTGFDLCA